MTNPQTFYTVGSQGGIDLSGIFQPIGSLTPAPDTGYKIQGGNDLSDIFAPLSSGTPIGYTTGFKVSNVNYQPNTDLSDIFAAYNPIPYTTNGAQSSTNPLSNTITTGWTYILFNSTTTSYYFNTNTTIPNLYYMIVGLGGSGQTTSATFGSGGGAGGIYNNYVNSFPVGNYDIVIPSILTPSNTTFINSVSSTTFSLIAESGSFVYRGAVNLTLNNVTTIPSASSSNII